MRRMMHAAVFFLVSVPLLQAQTPSVKPLPPQPSATHSLLSLSAEVHDDNEVLQDKQLPLSTTMSPLANSVSFIPRSSGRPYSQLASYMSCNDWSPNLWNGYSCERAAIVAVISQHVDMQCRCFDCKKSCMHNHASACDMDGCSHGDCCGKVGTKIVNRYRQNMSTLHEAPSDLCGATCGTSCSAPSCVAQAACSSGTCTANAIYHASQTQSALGMQPSRPMIANPVINNPRSAMNVQNSYPKIESRR
jgi:hypothetical protein